MDWQVKWTQLAWTDLESIAEYIARDSKNYASAFVREVREASRSLRKFPERGRIVPELNDTSIRELLIGSYRLIYKIENENVFIIAFVHGARDLPALWKKDHRQSP